MCRGPVSSHIGRRRRASGSPLHIVAIARITMQAIAYHNRASYAFDDFRFGEIPVMPRRLKYLHYRVFRFGDATTLAYAHENLISRIIARICICL